MTDIRLLDEEQKLRPKGLDIILFYIAACRE